LDLGVYNVLQGNYLEGRRYLEEALNVFKDFGDKKLTVDCLTSLGIAARGLDEYEKAEALYRESLSIIHETGLGPVYLEDVSGQLGYTVLYLGDAAQAVSLFMEALELRREFDSRFGLIPFLGRFADVAAALGKAETAARLYGAWDAQVHRRLRDGETLDSVTSLVSRREYARYQAICREQLGDAAFDLAWHAGQSLSLEAAIAEALATV
jgi:tetratricopeptide (TPR) repeat protein